MRNPDDDSAEVRAANDCDIPEIVESAKRPVGRPKKDPSARRVKSFTVYFTQHEITEFSYQIAESGLNGQEYTRALISWAKKNGWKP